jgi:hypothetical protein
LSLPIKWLQVRTLEQARDIFGRDRRSTCGVSETGSSDHS